MTVSPATIWGPLQLTGSAAILGSAVPANGFQIIKRAVFTNLDNVPVAITVYVVRSGGTAGPTNELISAYPLSAGQAYPSPELANMVLNPGDAIYALASIAGQVTTVASGFAQ
jgi:hypothetical protein